MFLKSGLTVPMAETAGMVEQKTAVLSTAKLITIIREPIN